MAAAQPARAADAASRPEIVAILETNSVPIAIPIYSGGAADAQDVGPRHYAISAYVSHCTSHEQRFSMQCTHLPRKRALDSLARVRYTNAYHSTEEAATMMDMPEHLPPLPPVVKVAYQTLKEFLSVQPWRYWAVDTTALEPLHSYAPVSVETLVRVLKSHYTFSDCYIFRHTSTMADVAAINWNRIPLVTAALLPAYVITSVPGQPFLGFAGALHTAVAGALHPKAVHTTGAVQPGIAADRFARDRSYFDGFFQRARGS